LILADNTLASGRVVEDDPGEMGAAIRRFNDHVAADKRVETVMLTIRDGVTLIRKR
jgi:caffeoyl-CoA O-methyltransferase